MLSASATPLISVHLDAKELNKPNTDASTQRVNDLQWHPYLPNILFAVHAGGLCVCWDVARARELWTSKLELHAQTLTFDPFDGARFCVMDDEVYHTLAHTKFAER